MIRENNKLGYYTACCWFVILLVFVSVTGYDGLYGQDSNEYYRFSLRIASFVRSGIPAGDFFWPVNFPLAGALLNVITFFNGSLQLISLASAAIVIGLLSNFLIRQFPGREPEVLFYVIVLMGCSPFFFRYAVSCMSDTMAMALSCGCLYFSWCNIKSGSIKAFYSAMIFAGLAVFTRYAMFPLLFPAAVFLFFRNVRNLRFTNYIVVLSILALPLLVHWYFKQDHFAEILRHSLLNEWSFTNFIKSNFLIEEGRLEFQLPNIIAALSFLVHPGLAFPGVIFVVLMFTDRKSKPDFAFPVLLAGMTLYVLFVAGLNFQNQRYLVPLVPFLLVVCFPYYLKIISRFYTNRNLLSLIGGSVVLIQIALLYRAFIPFYKMNRTEKMVAETVILHNPPLLYTFGIEGAIENRGYRGDIISLHTAPLESIAQDAWLLFNKSQMEAQWNGKNPMNNYWFLMRNGNPRLIESPGDGWELYEITKTHPDPDPGFSGK